MARRLALGLILTLVLAAPAAGDPYDRKRAVDERISTLNERIAEAREREGALTEQISDVTEKIRLLEDDVGRASTTLEGLEAELS